MTVEDEEALEASLNEQWGLELPAPPLKHYVEMDARQTLIFHRLQQLSALMPELEKHNVDSKLQQTFMDRVMLFQRQVITLIWSMGLNNIRQHGSPARPQASAAVRACARTWHTSIVIYSYTVIGQMPPGSQIVRKIVARCRVSLANLSPTELWCDCPPKFLLWVLIIVGAASVGEWERAWMGKLLVEVRDRTNLGSWDEVKSILEDYVWIGSRCDKPCRAFWDESIALGAASEISGSESKGFPKI